MPNLKSITLCILMLASPAAAQSSATSDCRSLSSITADMTARALASATRACANQGDPRSAIQLYLTYSSFILFDQQRVKDESAHIIVSELNSWILTGYYYDQMQDLKVWIDQLRDPESDYLRETCAGILAIGPPSYRPDYMIIRGMQPRKSAEDWHVAGFDPNLAWDRAVHEINPCPRP
jgi:hypothetical protein